MIDAIDAVWFDLDGTLVDSSEGITQALAAAVDEVLPGVRVERPVAPEIGPPMPKMLQRLLPGHEPAHPEIVLAFRRHYDELGGWKGVRLYPGVVEAVSALHAHGLRLDIITNKRAAPTARILELLDLARFFDTVVSPDSARPMYDSKAAALQALLRSSSLEPERVVYVGDSPSDGDAADRAGCRFVWVEWGFGAARGSTSEDGRSLAVSSAADLAALLLPSPGRL